MKTQTAPATPGHQKSNFGLMWLVAAAIVVAIAVLAFVTMTGDSTPTVTFDGQSVTYDGPATFESGEHTFVFDGSAYEANFAFILGVVKDPTITDAYIEADTATTLGQPEYIGRTKVFWVTEDDPEARILEETFLLDADTRYAIIVITSRPDQAHFAQTFEVR